MGLRNGSLARAGAEGSVLGGVMEIPGDGVCPLDSTPAVGSSDESQGSEVDLLCLILPANPYPQGGEPCLQPSTPRVLCPPRETQPSVLPPSGPHTASTGAPTLGSLW